VLNEEEEGVMLSEPGDYTSYVIRITLPFFVVTTSADDADASG